MQAIVNQPVAPSIATVAAPAASILAINNVEVRYQGSILVLKNVSLNVGEGEIVASIAVMNPVQSGAVDIGYGVAPARRGRGHASRMVQALLLELAERGVETVRAETSVENPASARVLQKAGFTQTGARRDAEDGDLYLWARALI